MSINKRKHKGTKGDGDGHLYFYSAFEEISNHKITNVGTIEKIKN